MKGFTHKVEKADLGGKLSNRLGQVEAGRLLSKIVSTQIAFRTIHASKARRYFAKDNNPFAKPLNSFGAVDDGEIMKENKVLGEQFYPLLSDRVRQSLASCPLGTTISTVTSNKLQMQRGSKSVTTSSVFGPLLAIATACFYLVAYCYA